MILTEEMKKRFFNGEDFDLSTYLDTIPEEELKNQYEDYQSYEYINGLKTLPEENGKDNN